MKKKLRKFKEVFRSSLLLFTAGLLFSGCETHKFRHEEGIAWNTLYHITYESGCDLNDSILKVLDDIDNSLSPFNQNSTVSAINSNKSQSTDSHFNFVYSKSRQINEKTGGAFDPTLAPLIRAWGFGQGHEISSDTLRLDSLLNFVGINKTELKDNQLLKSDPRIEFNFSALAKGYGVDCIAEMLARNGVENYLVEVGGEIRAKGHNQDGKDWTIGIDRPDENAKTGETVISIKITDGAIATSGNYRNYHETAGGRVGHTISATSGRPVLTDIISATVIAPTCMDADALATSCMALGSEKALTLCDDLKVGVLLIKRDFSVMTNSYFNKYTTE